MGQHRLAYPDRPIAFLCHYKGEVELISMMKPKAQNEHEEGMLEYLEDIIGSNRFKEPIDILTQRIDKIHEVRSEKVVVTLMDLW